MEVRCRHFSGYKPCGKSKICDKAECSSFSKIDENILVVHLGALGAVVRSTSLLNALKSKHPHSRLTFITEGPADQILKDHPLIDRVLDSRKESLNEILNLEFSVAYCIDKSLRATSLLSQLDIRSIRGFTNDRISGAIVPASEHARELWNIGLNDELKFFKNKKTESQLVHEALDLGPYQRDEYSLFLKQTEWDLAEERAKLWRKAKPLLLGINVGCSAVIPYKKMSISLQRELIKEVQKRYSKELSIVLLGGREDLELAREISKDLNVTISPMDSGLRDGMVSVAACDLMVSGDSLGMHLGIGLKKWVVAWFGPTCSHEIDLYERGLSVLSDVPCGPCWRRVCDNTPMCYDRVPLDQILKGIQQGVEWKFSSFKPHSPEICF